MLTATASANIGRIIQPDCQQTSQANSMVEAYAYDTPQQPEPTNLQPQQIHSAARLFFIHHVFDSIKNRELVGLLKDPDLVSIQHLFYKIHLQGPSKFLINFLFLLFFIGHQSHCLHIAAKKRIKFSNNVTVAT